MHIYLVHEAELQEKSTLIGRDLKCNEGDRTNTNINKRGRSHYTAGKNNVSSMELERRILGIY